MNREQHVGIGIVSYLIYSYLFNSVIHLDSSAIFYGGMGVVIGSIIPDMLEKPTSWMHRGICHSKQALKIMAVLMFIFTLIGLLFWFFYVISGFFFGYTMHLLADATTEVGLM